MGATLRTYSFSGTPAEIGAAFGEACRDQIPQLYAARLQNAIRQAKVHGGRDVGEEAVLAIARACIEPTRAHHPEGFAELEGIARGAGLSLDRILAMNGLTDIRDVLAWGGELESLGGCSAFIVAGDQSESGKLVCGQTWDLATDNMPHVIGVHRKPSEGPETWTLTTVGCLSLIGLNDAGIAVGTTNIRTKDARPGVTYLSVIHKALSTTSLAAAEAAVSETQRAGAHYFFLADRHGKGLALETSPGHVDRVEVSSGAYVHTNHCLLPAHRAIESDTPSTSSHHRQDRLEAIIAADRGVASLSAAQRWLSDRENGENAISRTDFNNISTNGAVVMEPQTGTIHASHGPTHASTWIDLKTQQIVAAPT